MNTIIYKPSFSKILKLAKEKKLFLGSGNPNSNILFIGKEAAIDKNKSPLQYETEYLKNVEDWESNVSLNKQFEDIDNWITKPSPKFNSLYPYKGQKNKVESRNKEGKIIRGEFGTSKTWYNYQKIIDIIYHEGKEGELINFHEHAFCTELNQETGSYSKDIPKSKREESINKRKELFQQAFFREFTIIIVAVGHYVRDFEINLEEIFNMQFNDKLSKHLSQDLKNEYLNMHFDNIENPSKILIHTNQLSMVSNDLINKLGEVCLKFLERKLILENN